uniref:Cax-interacting protein 2 n=1 Tax=Tetraselmis sp. GSL018 TaxID=582737 RepID=A0A061RL32_9CHLO|mmetsp:Transcript_34511/g.81819  ORF Transcript_34511/g.81819 Transcript_34511/m.81819 type:complete len:308 (-) Transcript_34511:2950-3873(-)
MSFKASTNLRGAGRTCLFCHNLSLTMKSRGANFAKLSPTPKQRQQSRRFLTDSSVLSLKTRRCSSQIFCSSSLPALSDTPAVKAVEKGELSAFPPQPGVYAVYSPENELQYIGLSRRVSSSIKGHMQDMPDLVGSVKICQIDSVDKNSLMGAWKQWVQEAITTTGKVPPGNAPGVKDWTQGGSRSLKSDLRLTPGKGQNDLTCSMEELIAQVVKSYKIVAFVKGSRTDPECGFSFRVLSILNSHKVDYEVVNVLDEVHNPGLREAVKAFSMWPTIPQLYVNGEFVGGADIVAELEEKGELGDVLKGA